MSQPPNPQDLPNPDSQDLSNDAVPAVSYTDRSTAALVLGIVGFAPFVGPVTAILAIVFGSTTIAGIRANKIPISSSGQAKAGRVLGIIGLVISIFITLYIIGNWLGWYDEDTVCFVGSTGNTICVSSR